METIVSRGAPDMRTPGVVGDLYVDMDTDKVYRCLNVITEGSEMGFVKVTAYHIGNRTYEWGLLTLSGEVEPDTPDIPDEPDTGGWLFENQYLTTERALPLPAPVEGVSYTVFVNGVEAATQTCNDAEQWSFYTHDYEYCIVYAADPALFGESGWLIHPFDSTMTSGTVSIRING